MTVTFTAPTTGQYKIIFGHYQATTGNFEFAVNTANITQLVMSDWNLLAFNTTTGFYIPSQLVDYRQYRNQRARGTGLCEPHQRNGQVDPVCFCACKYATPGARVANRISNT